MRSNRRGIALILTLWILAVLIVLAAGLGMTVRTESQIARNYGDLIRCRWAARAGENRGIVQIESMRRQPQTYLGEQGLDLTNAQENIDLGDASYDTVIEDEAGKVNINTASRALLQNLFNSPDIADSIVDWRDKNDSPRPLGAETQYYAGLTTPYRAKNGPFDTVQELLLVKGITQDILSAPITADGRPLEELLTVYSHDNNQTVDGKQKINIQTAGRSRLKSEFGDILTDRNLDAIIRRRDRRAFRRAAEIINVPGLSRDKVRRIYDRLTVRTSNNRPGCININAAPVEVLAAVPGLDRGMAEEIVAYRSANGAFQDVGQLLAVAGVTGDAFARSADLFTVRSRVFKIVSTGRLAEDQSSRTITCVVDATDGQTTQIRYWRE